MTKRIKERCENDFTFFVRYFFKSYKGFKFTFNGHHQQICDALMDVYYGRTIHLIINMPPRYSKTELAVKMFSAWCYMKNPKCQFIHLSFSNGLAMDNSDIIKELITSDVFTSLWPHVTISRTKKGKKLWATVQGGTFYATAAGGPVTGYGAGILDYDGFAGAIIIDDPFKPDEAHSNVKRKKVNDRWDSTIKSRFNSKKTPCIVIMQRIHEDDFCGMLLKDSEYDFKLLLLPAIVDEGTKNERALWPHKESLIDLYRARKKNSYTFAGQQQQRPAPLGGGLIKGAWIKRYRILPQMKYRAMYVDTAQKKGQHNDYQAAGIYGIGVDGNLYLIDMLREKFEGYELEVRMPEFWHKHVNADSGRLRYMAVEDKVSGTDLIQKIKNTVKPRIPIKEIPRGSGQNKLTRIMDIQGYIESGYFYVPESAPWVHDFIKECESLTPDDTHANDDMVDTMCDAISDMLHSKTASIREML